MDDEIKKAAGEVEDDGMLYILYKFYSSNILTFRMKDCFSFKM